MAVHRVLIACGCDMPAHGRTLFNYRAWGNWWRRDRLATRAIEKIPNELAGPSFSLEVLEPSKVIFLHYHLSLYWKPVFIVRFWENWVLTETLVKRLESFRGKLAKQSIRWPKSHSSTAAIELLNYHGWGVGCCCENCLFWNDCWRMMQLGLGLNCYVHVLMILVHCAWWKNVWNWRRHLGVLL